MQRTFELTLGKNSYRVAATFEAIMLIEDKLGKSILSVVKDIKEIKDLRISTIVTVLHSCLLSSGEHLTEEQVGQQMIETGYSTCMGLAARILSSALTAGPETPDDEGEGGTPSGATKSGDDQQG